MADEIRGVLYLGWVLVVNVGPGTERIHSAHQEGFQRVWFGSDNG